MDDLPFARAVHVLAVVHWIGGLAFVTLVVLPLTRARAPAPDALALFTSVERRFSAQVRISVPVAGVSGLWMTWRLEVWDRFHDLAYWWMSAMLALWVVFMLMLFVLEPLLGERFERLAARNPAAALRTMFRLHVALLLLAAITVLGAVSGAHGFYFG